jgi:hypothetical protein
MSSRGRSGAAGPSRSHQSTTAGEVAVGGHRWSRPVERKAMTGGAAVSVRVGEGAGARARRASARGRARARCRAALLGRAEGEEEKRPV